MYQITNTDIRHGYLWANKRCGFVGIPKTANMQFRQICSYYRMYNVHYYETPKPEYLFCVVRDPWKRTLSGIGEYRRRKRRHHKALTWRGLLKELLENPKKFDEHLEPQAAFMYGHKFTHIFKFEQMLDDALKFPFFANDPDLIKANIHPTRATRSQYLDLEQIQEENQDLLDQIVEKYYARDCEIWSSPEQYINKHVR